MDRPDIYFTEKDESVRSKQIDLSSIGCAIGFASKGEAFKPTIVNSENFYKTFGNANLDNYLDHQTMVDYFEESGGANTYMTRFIHKSLPLSGASGTGYAHIGGSQNSYASFCFDGVADNYTETPILLLTNEEISAKQNAGVTFIATTAKIMFTAKSAGNWANGYKIAIGAPSDLGAIAFGSTTFEDIFTYPIDTDVNKQMFAFLLMDSDNNILEKYVLSTVEGIIDQYGRNVYAEDFLKTNSGYVEAFVNSVTSSNPIATSTTAVELKFGMEAPLCHSYYSSAPIADVNINGNADASGTDGILNSMNLFKDSESYPFDLFVDSGHSMNGTILVNVDTGGATENLPIKSDPIKNLYAIQLASDLTASISINDSVALYDTTGNLKGYVKVLALYGDGTGHFAIAEFDGSINDDDEMSSVVISNSTNIGGFRGQSVLKQNKMTAIAYQRMDAFLPMIVPTNFIVQDAEYNNATYKTKASLYFNTLLQADSTNIMNSYYAPYFGCYTAYISDLKKFKHMHLGGKIAGKYVANDKKYGEFVAPAGKFGATKIKSLYYSPKESARVDLNEIDINTLYTNQDINYLDGIETGYSMNSVFADIDIRRTFILVRKLLRVEALKVQFAGNFSAAEIAKGIGIDVINRDTFTKEASGILDKLVRDDAIRDFRILDTTTDEDEVLDQTRWFVLIKPNKTIKWVKVGLSLDDKSVSYEEI